ncbi:MAG: 1-acyl-sn-glycerol-3-phosphate acyltransferase [Bacteroidales bacterium]|nr:1-acyl-sn-glycerol-3-phosphate acyltransferase [Bacteroidales bacterium]
MRSKFYAVISILLFGVLYCYTAIGVFIILVFAFLRMKRPIRVLSQFWAKSVFIIIGKKLHVQGRENINKVQRYILVANHASLFDIVAIMSIYSGISWFGHERLLKVPLFGMILRMTDYVPFKEPTVRNTKEMLEQLVLKSREHTVAIFPEGTRTLDGKINDFYKGFIYLFRTSDIGILPVTLNGFYKLKPKNRASIDFDSRLEVIIHEPIKREDLIEKTDIEIIEAVKSIIESAYK